MKHLNENNFDEDDYFGFFSPKFHAKTNLNASDIYQMIEEDDRQSDVYLSLVTGTSPQCIQTFGCRATVAMKACWISVKI